MSKEERVGKDSFEKIKVIGRGHSSEVFLVRHKDSGEFFAMKVTSIDRMRQLGELEHIRTERDLLIELRNPFIVNLHYAFVTNLNVYLILDFPNGGELFEHLKINQRFEEKKVVEICSEILLFIEKCHEKNLLYRSLKPENILFDFDGHVRVIDFGLSRKMPLNEKGEVQIVQDFVGTPEYMAVEIIQGDGYGFPVDYYTLGVLIYECIVGVPPFYSENLNEMYQNIFNAELTFPRTVVVSNHAKNLITKLLHRDPKERLCQIDKVKNHPFFKSVEWVKVENRMNKSILQLELSGPDDVKYIEREFLSQPIPKDDPNEKDEDEDEGEVEEERGGAGIPALRNFYYSWPAEIAKKRKLGMGMMDLKERILFLVHSCDRYFDEEEDRGVIVEISIRNQFGGVTKISFPRIIVGRNN